MKSIAVFCGASGGNAPEYMEMAYEIGKNMAQKNITLVFGGGKVGMMGAAARGALENGGKVIGVIPHFLYTKEIAYEEVTELITVDNMHIRKAKMYEISDGMIALPGGFGTMDEMFEVLTWAQLGLHPKPIGILNMYEFYTPLLDFIQNMYNVGFLSKHNHEMLLQSTNFDDLYAQMMQYQAPPRPSWLNASQL